MHPTRAQLGHSISPNYPRTFRIILIIQTLIGPFTSTKLSIRVSTAHSGFKLSTLPRKARLRNNPFVARLPRQLAAPEKRGELRRLIFTVKSWFKGKSFQTASDLSSADGVFSLSKWDIMRASSRRTITSGRDIEREFGDAILPLDGFWTFRIAMALFSFSSVINVFWEIICYLSFS